MKHLLLLFLLLFSPVVLLAQTRVVTSNKLIIDHGDIILYLTNDTCTSVSKHTITYSKYRKLDNERNDQWFQDTYKGKYTKSKFNRSGYDLGHLTPSHITSYDNTLNHMSFSLFNQSPQLAAFNRGKWARLEKQVEDLIKSNKVKAIIITGVVYNYNDPQFLPGSKIRIPIAYYKIVTINGATYAWIGSNINGEIITTDVVSINEILKYNNMGVLIK